MHTDIAALKVIDTLESLNVDYMIVGSLSASYYGIVRMTQDADFVLQVDPSTINRIAQELGPQFTLDPQMSFETVTATTRYGIYFTPSDFQIEFFILTDEVHDKQRFARRVRAKVAGRQTWVPTAEDVIITKLRWSKHARRTKDADDVRDVLAVQGDNLDWPYLHEWCSRHETLQLLNDIRAQIPF